MQQQTILKITCLSCDFPKSPKIIYQSLPLRRRSSRSVRFTKHGSRHICGIQNEHTCQSQANLCGEWRFLSARLRKATDQVTEQVEGEAASLGIQAICLQ